MKKRVVFFGTPRFAATILSYLLEQGVNIVACVTKPDKPQGRSSTLVSPPVKKIALEHNLPLFQPLKASTPEFAEEMRRFQPDLFVVVAYSEIFREILLTLPPLGCINVHASLLPKYRGAAPIQRAVMAGERETGVTIMRMVKELDAGEMYAVGKMAIGPEMTSGEVFEELAKVGGVELLKVVKRFEEGEVAGVAQDHSQATFAPKVTPQEGEIDWNRSAQELHNHIRGVTPKPGAWCWVEVKGERKRLAVKKACISNLNGRPGVILDGPGLIIACREGALSLLEVQLEGKKSLSTSEFLRGISKNNLSFVLIPKELY